VCGICGIANHGDDHPADEEVVRAMAAAMTHRGPDEDGFLVDGEVALGMRRLSIIDLEGGTQPIADERGDTWVVSNGEIYNFRELRRELRAAGHVFRTASDTEVIVHAYEEWGLDAFARLNGMFATAVWDATARRLVLARDPFGVKPLYVHDDGTTLAFASEVRALLCHPSVARAVDLEGLVEYVSLTYVPSPRTAFAGVRKLLPGHALVCDEDGVREHRFHRPDRSPLEEPDGVLVERLRDAIARAVRRQMVADVPVGVMLSGGSDSAAVAALMTAAADGPVRSFTVGFADGFSGDERAAARRSAALLGTDHHELTLSPAAFEDALPRSVAHLEEPVATTSAFAFWKLSELAREHVKVVLTGQGADEPFAGYPRHLGERYGALYRRLPPAARRLAVGPLVGLLPRSEALKRAARSLGEHDGVARLTRVYTVLDEDLRGELLLGGANALAGAGGARGIEEAIARWHADTAGLDPLGRMLYVDARVPLPDNLLLYGDKMSMAASLEARVPFLDLELMDLAERLPSRVKIAAMRQKRILKDAVAAWLPPEILARRKLGFATPVDAWFRGELNGAVGERLLDAGSGARRYFSARVMERMLDEHRTGRHDHKRILFSLLAFEVWHEQFIAPATWAGQRRREPA
jgi:asparagine synthase (glutamine-hydrolysing)